MPEELLSLTQEEIQFIKNQKLINEKEKQINVLIQERESALVLNEDEKKTIINTKDTAINDLQQEIDDLKNG